LSEHFSSAFSYISNSKQNNNSILHNHRPVDNTLFEVRSDLRCFTYCYCCYGNHAADSHPIL